jgi:hypothetical protein
MAATRVVEGEIATALNLLGCDAGASVQEDLLVLN